MNWKAAEEALKRLVTSYENTIGIDHHQTIRTLQSLSIAYCQQEKLKEGENVLHDCLHRLQKKYPKDHPLVFKARNDLAAIIVSEGDLNRAQKMYETTYDAIRLKMGSFHPYTLRTMQLLANVLMENGQLEKAEILYKECIAIEKRVYGANDLVTLDTLNNLAMLYEAKHQYDKSRALLLECLAGRRVKLGDTDPLTLTTQGNIAGLYYAQGNFIKAEKIYFEVLEGYRKSVGSYNLATLVTLNNCAIVCWKEKKYDMVETLYLEVILIKTEMYGQDHDSTIESLNKLAQSYFSSDRIDDAEIIECEVFLRLTRRQLGFNRPETLRIKVALSKLCDARGGIEVMREKKFMEIISGLEMSPSIKAQLPTSSPPPPPPPSTSPPITSPNLKVSDPIPLLRTFSRNNSIMSFGPFLNTNMTNSAKTVIEKEQFKSLNELDASFIPNVTERHPHTLYTEETFPPHYFDINPTPKVPHIKSKIIPIPITSNQTNIKEEGKLKRPIPVRKFTMMDLFGVLPKRTSSAPPELITTPSQHSTGSSNLSSTSEDKYLKSSAVRKGGIMSGLWGRTFSP